MTENQQPDHDPLEQAIGAFQRMTVPERPPDAELLAQIGIRQGDLSGPSCIPTPSKKRYLVPLLVSAAAAAVLLLGAGALFLRNSAPPESDHVAATGPSGTAGGVAVAPLPGSNESARQSLGEERSLEESVGEAQVIVVATALDFTRAAPKRPGDLPEFSIRFRVTRVLKGTLPEQVITTQTPTAADEFIGKEWVLLLSPEYVTGKHRYADCNSIEAETEVKAILSRGTK
jgi:hypothetical protein